MPERIPAGEAAILMIQSRTTCRQQQVQAYGAIDVLIADSEVC